MGERHRLGWAVHGWRWPVVWWARRKPRSLLRQRIWTFVDDIEWRRTMRWYRARMKDKS